MYFNQLAYLHLFIYEISELKKKLKRAAYANFVPSFSLWVFAYGWNFIFE